MGEKPKTLSSARSAVPKYRVVAVLSVHDRAARLPFPVDWITTDAIGSWQARPSELATQKSTYLYFYSFLHKSTYTRHETGNR